MPSLLLSLVTAAVMSSPLTLPGDIVDREQVTERGAELLLPHVPMLSQAEAVTIAVHTDSMGSSGFNKASSQARAELLRDWLAERGVSKRGIRVEGCGEDYPKASNSTTDGQTENRRVVLRWGSKAELEGPICTGQ